MEFDLNYGRQLHSTGRFLMSHAIGSGIFTVVSTCACGPHVCGKSFHLIFPVFSFVWDTVILVSDNDGFVYVAGL